jgi:hypothetical protein
VRDIARDEAVPDGLRVEAARVLWREKNDAAAPAVLAGLLKHPAPGGRAAAAELLRRITWHYSC